MAVLELDALEQLAASVFEGYIARKDLARSSKGRHPVPEYVAEFPRRTGPGRCSSPFPPAGS